MATNLLTDRFCASLKPDLARRTVYCDATERGLELRVTPQGAKSWSVRYRTADGHQRRLGLGDYPQVGLKKARQDARKAKTRVDSGEDPAGAKRQATLRARAEPIKTVDDLFNAYFRAVERGQFKARKRPKRVRTIADEKRTYQRNIKPSLAQVRLDDLKRADIRATLRALADRGLGVSVNRTQALLRQALNFAIHEERISTNPAVGLAPLAEERSRTRILSDKEIKVLWRGLNSPEDLRTTSADGARAYVGRTIAIALQIALLTGQRRQEIAGMRLSELDLDQGLWRLGADRMKGHVEHVLPLPPLAVSLIEEALGLRGAEDGDPVFPHASRPADTIAPDSLSSAMRTARLALKLDGPTVHDLRRTVATNLASEHLKVPPYVISRILAHQGGDGGAAVTRQHYNIYSYLPEMREALSAWEARLLSVVA